ncbi:MAG TPA: D-alanyl-D-alanine carboxypeptidase family protein [Burkholderiales bacterium]|nr:D-alanyl-D-alanine carboxypeptidase family protein [Burkholderiales bacterium]
MLRSLLAFVAAFCAVLAHAQALQPPPIDAKSWLLVDLSSNRVLASYKPDERVQPASLTKMMTAYLVFTALRDKKLSLEQQIPVSVHAWKAPGSRMFIQPGMPVTVDQLIRGMEIESGNDAATALAEAVAGSEDVFVQMMNREAQRLGMDHTHYMNATGLPDPQHYTTAHDLYLLASALIRDFPQDYARYYALKEFSYNHITQANRNRLLWLDPSVDGVKTGHTEAAGYCLIGSAKRGPRRLMSVLLGAPTDAARTDESLKLLNWGFQFFDSVRLYGKDRPVTAIRVWKGAAPEVQVGFLRDFVITVPKGDAGRLKADLSSQQPLVAPVAKGQRIGVLRLSLDDKPLGEYPVVALEAVPAAGIFRRAWDTLRLWVQ